MANAVLPDFDVKAEVVDGILCIEDYMHITYSLNAHPYAMRSLIGFVSDDAWIAARERHKQQMDARQKAIKAITAQAQEVANA